LSDVPLWSELGESENPRCFNTGRTVAIALRAVCGIKEMLRLPSDKKRRGLKLKPDPS
jgi:hypothetical protein